MSLSEALLTGLVVILSIPMLAFFIREDIRRKKNRNTP